MFPGGFYPTSMYPPGFFPKTGGAPLRRGGVTVGGRRRLAQVIAHVEMSRSLVDEMNRIEMRKQAVKLRLAQRETEYKAAVAYEQKKIAAAVWTIALSEV